MNEFRARKNLISLLDSSRRLSYILRRFALFCVAFFAENEFALRRAQALPVARFKSVRPLVQVKSGGSAPFVSIRARGALRWGNFVRTGPKGSADILFSNGTLVAMKPQSNLEIVSPRAAGSPLVIRVFGALSEVFVRPKGNTQIRTMAAIAAARGTEFLVQLPTEDSAVVSVNEGSVDFSNPQGAVLVQQGEQSSARVGVAPTQPIRVDVSGLLEWTTEVAALPLRFETAPNQTISPALATIIGQLNDGQNALARASLQPLLNAANNVADRANAQTLAGWLALQDGDSDAARKYLQMAVQTDAASFQAHSFLALTLLNDGEVSLAQNAAKTAVGLRPQSSLTQSTLALVSFFAGDTKTARRAARLGGQSDELSPFALLMQGRLALADNDLKTARDFFAQAVSLSPRLPLLRRELGTALLQLDQLPRAQNELRRALELSPKDASTQTLLAIALQREGKSTEARALYLQVLAGDAGNVFARGNFAQLLLDEGDLGGARRELERVEATRGNAGGSAPNGDDPALGQIYLRLSETALLQQKLREAFDWARRAVRLLPDSAPAHYQLGRVYLEQERTLQAEQQFRLAVVLDPQFDRARYALGLVREKTQRSLFQIAPNLDGPAFLGGAGGAGTLQNLQTPGASERIQGFSADPTIAREASRSYGDTEIGGSYGTRDTLNVGVSRLKLNRDRRGIAGVNLEIRQTDGVRDGGGQNFNRGGVLLGQKARQSASSAWLLGNFESDRLQRNRGVTDEPRVNNDRFNDRIQRVLGGFNFEPNDRQRTRVLAAFDRSQFGDRAPSFGLVSRFGDRSANVELRHDWRLSRTHRIIAGASVGQRTRRGTIIGSPPFEVSFGIANEVEQQTLYLRDEWQTGPRLRLTSELRLNRLDYTQLFRNVIPPFPDDLTQRQNLVGVPNFVLDYNASRNSTLRLRARRLSTSIEDFGLLNPTDVFGLNFNQTADADSFNPLSSGRSVEMELNHTFSNANFLSAGVFQRDARNTFGTPRARSRGFQAGYEGTLSRDLTFFTRALFNSSSDEITDLRFTETPSFSGAIGLQYLNERGYFLQGNAVYASAREREINSIRTQLGGGGIVNLRAGKRNGLRSSVFVEVLNVLDKTYDLDFTLQPMRQVRVGLIQRF